MPELPLNPNGKVDRARLSELRQRLGTEADPGPESETIERLASLWAEALERDRIDPDESFMQLGGDSLRAAVIAADVHERFGVDFGLDAFDEELDDRAHGRDDRPRRSAGYTASLRQPPPPVARRRCSKAP